MAEPNILLTRIDNRLVHGHVATQWNSTLGSNLILVANDDVASNTMLPEPHEDGRSRRRRYAFLLSAEDHRRHWPRRAPRQKIFIVAETPEDVLTLVKGGVPIKKVNIGNMHMSEGKRQVATSVAVNDEDVAAFKELQELGVELEIRRVPSTPVEDTSKLFS